jgi:hypothetical protein
MDFTTFQDGILYKLTAFQLYKTQNIGYYAHKLHNIY